MSIAAFPDELIRNGTIIITRERDEHGDWNIVAVIINGEPASITDALRIMGNAKSTITSGVSTGSEGRLRQVEYAYER